MPPVCLSEVCYWRRSTGRAAALTSDALNSTAAQVAAKAGYDIPSSCLSGQCGACEVEVTKTDRVTGAKSSGMVRSCIAGFPPGYSRVEVEDLADAIWGADGMDM